MRSLPVAFATVALAVVLATTSAPTPSAARPLSISKSPAPAVLGISTRSAHGTLAWFDPLTLNALRGRRVALADHMGSWAFSADRAVLALGGCQEHHLPSIRFVNAHAMRVLGDVLIAPGGDCVERITWISQRRLLALVRGTTASDSGVAVIDPVARRVLRTVQVGSDGDIVWRSLATRNELVLLLARYEAFAPARIAVVDAEGNVRIGPVDQIRLGTVFDEGTGDPRGTTVSPGFAVDPDGRRAFLVPPSGAVAEIDLRTLAISYHDLRHPSLLQRFLQWLEPAAQAKAIDGPTREARWLGDGMLAVSGLDYSTSRNRQGDEVVTATPTGVELIDTASWTSKMLSRASSSVAAAPDLVIAQGGRWDPGTQKTIGPGVLAFGADGRERWRLPDLWIDAHPVLGYGYVGVGDPQNAVRIVNLATGEVLRTVKRDWQAKPGPALLDAQVSEW